jgi:hypothetical protein
LGEIIKGIQGGREMKVEEKKEKNQVLHTTISLLYFSILKN